MKEIENMQITTVWDTWRITMSFANVITDTASYNLQSLMFFVVFAGGEVRAIKPAQACIRVVAAEQL